MVNQNLNSLRPALLITPNISQGQLPRFLEDALSVAQHDHQRDMLLLSLLTNCAYALPSMRTYHGKPRHEYGTDMMTLILAPAASGKGIMNYGRRLLQAIEGVEGKQVYIPANTSSSGLINLLQQFKGHGIMMGTEMDTLSQSLKSNYGQFSDVIRCIFEHESISQLRKRNNEFIEIHQPHVSMMRSGTLNQLSPLIKNRENGLMSRFACYVVKDRLGFEDDVWEADSDNAIHNSDFALYERLSEEIGMRYLWMSSQEHACVFRLTENQRDKIKRMFRSEYEAYVHVYDSSFDQTLKRMPVIMKRIGMILTGLRLDINKPLPEQIYCSDEDFQTMLLLGHKLLIHAALMYDLLPKEQLTEVGEPQQQVLKKQFLDMLPAEFTKQDIIAQAKTIGVSVRTVEGWINKLIQTAIIERLTQGSYRKKALATA